MSSSSKFLELASQATGCGSVSLCVWQGRGPQLVDCGNNFNPI